MSAHGDETIRAAWCPACKMTRGCEHLAAELEQLRDRVRELESQRDAARGALRAVAGDLILRERLATEANPAAKESSPASSPPAARPSDAGTEGT